MKPIWRKLLPYLVGGALGGLCIATSVLASSVDDVAKYIKVLIRDYLQVTGSGSATNYIGGAETILSNLTAIGTSTNLLFSVDQTLWYQSADKPPSSYAGVGVTNTTEANAALFQSGGNLAVIRGTAGVALIDGLSTGNDLRWFNKYFAPAAITDAKLGGDENVTMQPWQAVHAFSNFVWGFRDTISTNYSRAVHYHTGTNGAYYIDLQARGTAGAARDLIVVSNGTANVVGRISANSGYGGGGTKALSDDGTYKPFGTSSLVINPTDNYIPVRANSTTFADSGLYRVGVTNVALDSQLIWGPGASNVLYRSGSQLVYTNGATSGNGVTFAIVNGNGVTAVVGVDQDQHAVVRADTGKIVRIEPNTGTPTYAFSTSDFHSTSATDVGQQAAPFANGWFTNNVWALLSVGDTTFVDMSRASQTNQLSGGNMTWAHATNGLTGAEATHVRTVYAAGANRTVTLPSGWHNINGTSITVTQNTVVKIYVTSDGDTSSSALQTNVFSRCEYFP